MSEVGHQGAVSIHGEGVTGVSGNHTTILLPIDKGVARCGSSRHSTTLAIVEGATATNVTTVIRVGRHINSIGIDGEVSHQGAVSVHSEGIVGIGGDHIAILCPIGEGIARGSRCTHRAALAIVEGATASDITTIARVGRHTNSIGASGEVSY